MLKKLMFLALATFATACAATPVDSAATGDEANVTEGAKLELGVTFGSRLTGRAKAGSALEIDYALERLPQCRGNVGGHGPGWDIGGFYSLNGGPATSFQVTQLSEDGLDRVSKPARITPPAGGDLAIWFEVSSVFGCHEYDSQFGQNFHVQVEGAPPEAGASITFKTDGTIDQTGDLQAGSKVKIRYEQDRLPDCRRVQGGIPQWSIGGSASINGGKAQTFSTGRPNGADREETDAILDLTSSGDLALWFEVNDIGGCHAFDSKKGANYHFTIK